MKKLRIIKVNATELSLSDYIRLQKEYGVLNFEVAYFLQVRVCKFWLTTVWATVKVFISSDSEYALLCANEALDNLQGNIG